MPILSNIRLHNFRNYTSREVELSGGVQLFTGANGQGKTNLLEAVYYLSLLRSFRCKQVGKLKKHGADSFFLEGRFQSLAEDEGSISSSVDVLYGERRRLRVNGNTVDRASEFINQFLCIAFAPEDLALVKGPAGERRRFADILLSQIYPSYLSHLQRFTEALKNRNALLKNIRKFGRNAVRAYDGILVEHGVKLTEMRREFLGVFRIRMEEIFPVISENVHGEFLIRYSSAILRESAESEHLCDVYAALLEKNFDRECVYGATSVGPHRDEFPMSLGSKPLSDFGSEGQCRIVALALRLASLKFIKKDCQVRRGIILLVDDVLGELDENRRASFFNTLEGADQILVAATDVPPVLKDRVASVYRIKSGEIESC